MISLLFLFCVLISISVEAADLPPLGIQINYVDTQQGFPVNGSVYLTRTSSGRFASSTCPIFMQVVSGGYQFVSSDDLAVSTVFSCPLDFALLGLTTGSSGSLVVSVAFVDYGVAGLPMSAVRQSMLWGSAVVAGLLFVGQIGASTIGGAFAQAKYFAR